MKRWAENQGGWLVGLLLASATLLAFWPVTDNGFINYDDPFYVTNNPDVNGGLTARSVKWAFTAMHASNWHPLTWLTHMLDCELFGLNARAHHLVNLAWHIANTLLLFTLLKQLTGYPWRSAFVAALFALHPMHVESVAWVSERKDVLSSCWFMLCVIGYTKFVKWRTNAKAKAGTAYGLTLVCFTLGLMSKPMLVTLPCVLLLLDFWPLRRFEWGSQHLNKIAVLLLEKLPFFLLTGLSCILTILAQSRGGSVAPTIDISLSQRLTNSAIAYGWYVWRLFFPADQAVIYPLLPERPIWQVAASALLLVSLTILVIWQERRRPWLMFGWFWFLGLLVPVIGLVQVGMQAYADRYTYLPYIGLFLALTWAVAEFTKAWQHQSRYLASAAILVLGLCAAATHRQVQFWSDDETLYRRALAVTENNYIAMNNLAFELSEHGEIAEAIQLAEASLAIAPRFGEAYNTIGCARLRQKQPDLALPAFEQAVAFRPNNAIHRNNLGTALHELGRYEEAARAYEAALQVDPSYADSHYNLGNTLAALGQSTNAIASYERALVLRPDFANCHLNQGYELLRLNRRGEAKSSFLRALEFSRSDVNVHYALGQMANDDGEFSQAEDHWRKFLSANPDHSGARVQLAIALLTLKQPAAAAAEAREVIRHSPDYVQAHYWLAVALAEEDHVREAIQHYERVLALSQDHAEALNNLAWLLSSSPDDSIRDGKRAVALAERACELTKGESPLLLGTLAAAYAETGEFTKAITTAEQARDLAQKYALPEIAAKNAALLALYRTGKTCRDLTPETPQ